jgi:CheY-like chemotaxis protein
MLQVLLFHADTHGGDRIRGTLTAYGCDAEVTHVRNVTGFLAALEQWRFAAILLDYALSSSESSAALAAARRWWPAIPIIALCAPDGEHEGRRALREGAVDYVPEDQLPRLTSTIRRAVANMESPAQA